MLCIVNLIMRDWMARVSRTLLRLFHANFHMTEHVSQSEEDSTIKYNVRTKWSDLKITRSSLQKFVSRGPTLMSLFSRSHASGWTRLYWTTVSQLYNCNHNIAKEIMFYEIYFIKHCFFRYIHGDSSYLSRLRHPLTTYYVRYWVGL